MNRDSIKDEEVNDISQELSKDILEYTGINLNKGYIKYLILKIHIKVNIHFFVSLLLSNTVRIWFVKVMLLFIW